MPSESEIQQSVAQVLDHLGLFWCHVPNEGKRGPRQLQKLLAEGLRPGMPDVLVFEPLRYQGVPYSGLALELKTTRGKTSERQRQCLDQLAMRGYLSAVAYGIDSAIKIIQACDWQRIQAPLIIDTDTERLELWRRRA